MIFILPFLTNVPFASVNSCCLVELCPCLSCFCLMLLFFLAGVSSLCMRWVVFLLMVFLFHHPFDTSYFSMICPIQHQLLQFAPCFTRRPNSSSAPCVHGISLFNDKHSTPGTIPRIKAACNEFSTLSLALAVHLADYCPSILRWWLPTRSVVCPLMTIIAW